MPKKDTTEKNRTSAKRPEEEGGAEPKANKKTRSASEAPPAPDSASELEPVRTKKGEPPDNLRRRAAWFQKRTGGG